MSKAIENLSRFKNETIYLQGEDTVLKFVPGDNGPAITAKRAGTGEYPISSETNLVQETLMAWDEITKEEYNDFK